MKNDRTFCAKLIVTIIAVALIVDDVLMFIEDLGYISRFMGVWVQSGVGLVLLLIVWIVWPMVGDAR